MTAAWMMYLLFVGALIALAAKVLATAMRTIGRPTRWIWAGALASVPVLALAAPRQAVDRVQLAPAVASRVAVAAVIDHAPVDPLTRLRGSYEILGDRATAVMSSLAERVPRPVVITLVAVWVVGSAMLLILFVTVNVRIARARRRWPLSNACGTAVRVAPSSGPAVLGLLRAEIVVPRSLLERSAEEQRLILAHEREHVRARDHLLLAGAWLVAIALPWHPTVWALINRLRLAIELDCDARVLRAGESAKTYGALLIDVAAHHGGIRIGALALADGPSHLERRILAMNAPRKRHALAYGALLSGLGGLLVLAACEAKVPTSAEIVQMDVAKAEKSAAEAGFMRTPDNNRTDFFLNGVPVSAERARAIEAKDIGSIEIVKSELPTGRDTIFVTTPDRMPRPVPDAAEAGRARSPGEYAVLQKKVDEASHEKLVAHVEAERGVERMRTASATQRSKIPAPPLPMRMKLRDGGAEPVVLIDGKPASEEQLSKVDQKDIASIAVYKANARLQLSSDGKGDFNVTSGPSANQLTALTKQDITSSYNKKVAAGAPIVSVTTKMGRAAAKP
jgi:beta-lactamase regulating signal transducer with metallopeptidase domain